MMDRAEERAKKMGLKNIVFKQGDIGALPFEDNSFDIVLSQWLSCLPGQGCGIQGDLSSA